MRPTESLFEFMPYGAPELLQSRRTHMAGALLLSSAIVLVLYGAAGRLPGLVSAPIPVPRMPRYDLTDWPPPVRPEAVPKIVRPTAPRSPAEGIPVPVHRDIAPPEVSPWDSPADGDASPRAVPGSGEPAVPGTSDELLPAPDAYVYTEELPEPVTMITPSYPDIAKAAGVEGLVIVRVLVGRDGRVRDVLLDPRHDVPMLSGAALEAARKWVFRPALANGRPVAVWTAIPFVFRLR